MKPNNGDEKRIVVALDFPGEREALELAGRLDPDRCRLKVGKELFTRCGPDIVRRLQGLGFQLFLDLKFHDIPNTTAAACAAAADLGVWMVNVHALGGRRMMEAALEAVSSTETKLVAVTVLTSMERADLAEIGLDQEPRALVDRLAALAHDSGLHGLVCSPHEAQALRQRFGPDFLLVTPGVRPADAELDDQRRVMTPAQAIEAGASHLVVGRPITRAQDPAQRFEQIWKSIRM